MHVSKVLGAALLGAATSSPVGGKREDSFQNEMIASHNYFRAQHSADDLVWDENIAQDAQNWANTCNFYHDSAGENLGCMSSYDFWGQFTNAWGTERENYNYDDPGFTPETGHFTQVVWKATTSLGCGWAQCSGGHDQAFGYYVVCKYDPPGNYNGQFGENVGRQVQGQPADAYMG
ncbi:uncharacterized protein UV8b_01486 [Ustilaginoidea virens]|uniref:SCP domain-containing protein n=1 Tax=Ustilaginoidea virens TaxID=1159556 RepID=A0A8E5HKR1_USTVR|nr:uncharacterized protein UV8b_01486 [Ustilaginoidea virens]QUC17245.1 hypothetical protein UV8b_01486 [Ustilaginoidea virens]